MARQMWHLKSKHNKQQYCAMERNPSECKRYFSHQLKIVPVHLSTVICFVLTHTIGSFWWLSKLFVSVFVCMYVCIWRYNGYRSVLCIKFSYVIFISRFWETECLPFGSSAHFAILISNDWSKYFKLSKPKKYWENVKIYEKKMWTIRCISTKSNCDFKHSIYSSIPVQRWLTIVFPVRLNYICHTWWPSMENADGAFCCRRLSAKKDLLGAGFHWKKMQQIIISKSTNEKYWTRYESDSLESDENRKSTIENMLLFKI